MSNSINIKIDISDELIGKFMTVMLASASPMPMIAPMMAPPSGDPKSKKGTIGFQSREKKCE
jgi:hypothetical protein